MDLDHTKIQKLKSLFSNMEYSETFDSDALLKDWIKSKEGPLGTLVLNRTINLSKEDEDIIEFCNPMTGDPLTNLKVYKGSGKISEILKPVLETTNDTSDLQARSKIIYNIARNLQKSQRLLALAEGVTSGRHITTTSTLDVPNLIRCFYHCAGLTNLENVHSQVQVIVATERPSPIFSLCWSLFPLLARGTRLIFYVTVEISLSTLVFADICKLSGLPESDISVVLVSKSSLIPALQELKECPVNVVCQTDETLFNFIQESTKLNTKFCVRSIEKRPTVIITESADILSAVDGCLIASYNGIGTCQGSRVLVQESILSKFEKQITERFQELKIGLWNNKNADFSSCITNMKEVDHLLSVINETETEGALVIRLEKTSPVYLVVGAQPASSVVQKQTKGVVIILIPFRSVKEAIAITNSSPGTVVASIWSERLTVATEIAKSIIAKTVWINTQNHYDRPNDQTLFGNSSLSAKISRKTNIPEISPTENLEIDETYKLFYGGGQKRPLSKESYPVHDLKGHLISLAPNGGKKDARNAVEAALLALPGWKQRSGHNRAQLLYYLTENLQKRKNEFSTLISKMTGLSKVLADEEINSCINDIFKWAGFCDKSSGELMNVPVSGFCFSVTEPVGVISIVSQNDENVLRGILTPSIAAIACGNTVVAVPSTKYPLAALTLYQVLDTSDMPSGVFNIICGNALDISKCLFDHHDIAGFWSDTSLETLLARSTIVNNNNKIHWVMSETASSTEQYQYNATSKKLIWMPSGDSFGN